MNWLPILLVTFLQSKDACASGSLLQKSGYQVGSDTRLLPYAKKGCQEIEVSMPPGWPGRLVYNITQCAVGGANLHHEPDDTRPCGLETSTVFLHFAHGDPDGWESLQGSVQLKKVRAGNEGLRYFFLYACNTLAHGPEKEIGPKGGAGAASLYFDFVAPHAFTPGSGQNVFERWREPAQQELRMVCGGSSKLYAHSFSATKEIWEAIAFNGKDSQIAEEVLFGLSTTPWQVPLCLSHGGSGVKESPLFEDVSFVSSKNLGGKFVHIWYPVWRAYSSRATRYGPILEYLRSPQAKGLDLPVLKFIPRTDQELPGLSVEMLEKVVSRVARPKTGAIIYRFSRAEWSPSDPVVSDDFSQPTGILQGINWSGQSLTFVGTAQLYADLSRDQGKTVVRNYGVRRHIYQSTVESRALFDPEKPVPVGFPARMLFLAPAGVYVVRESGGQLNSVEGFNRSLDQSSGRKRCEVIRLSEAEHRARARLMDDDCSDGCYTLAGGETEFGYRELNAANGSVTFIPSFVFLFLPRAGVDTRQHPPQEIEVPAFEEDCYQFGGS